MKRAESATYTYVDLLDTDRILVIQPGKGNENTVQAKVYWNKNVAGKTVRVFGGTSQVPRSLLLVGEESRRGASRPRRWEEQESQSERIGYMSEPAYQRKLERERTQHRYNDED